MNTHFCSNISRTTANLPVKQFKWEQMQCRHADKEVERKKTKNKFELNNLHPRQNIWQSHIIICNWNWKFELSLFVLDAWTWGSVNNPVNSRKNKKIKKKIQIQMLFSCSNRSIRTIVLDFDGNKLSSETSSDVRLIRGQLHLFRYG